MKKTVSEFDSWLLFRSPCWPQQLTPTRSRGVWWASLTATHSPCSTQPTRSTRFACPASIARKKQPFGQHCKQSLSDLAYGRTVAVESSKLDRWGRVIGKVLVGGEDANLEQVRRGCGWHYKQYQNEQILDDRLAYNRAEESARAGRVGLWADRDPLAPWEWRKARRK